MNVLVFGSTGQVAEALSQTLPAGVEAEFLNRLQADFTDVESLHALVVRRKPDFVIIAAAYTAVDQAEREAELANRINGEAPGAIARACRDVGAVLMHYSTDYVFSGDGIKAWREDDKIQPLSVYGHSKAEGERQIRASGGQHFIFRTSWVYSHHGRNFLRTMLKLGAERETLTVVNDQFGAPTAAQDIARATWQVIEKVNELRATPMGADRLMGLFGTYHLAARGMTNWQEFARLILALAREQGLTVKVEAVNAISTADYPTAARRPLNSRLDTHKIKENFGIELPEWQSSVAKCILRLVSQAGGSAQSLVEGGR